jgi:hypothetical chaperone protein
MMDKTRIGNRRVPFRDVLTAFLGHIKNKAEANVNQPIARVVMGRPVHFHDDNPGADQESQEFLRDIAHDIGFKQVTFQYEPIVAAYAHEQIIEHPKLSIVIDLGGGTSDFTIIRLDPDNHGTGDRADDILASHGIRVGGTDIDNRLSMRQFMPHLGLGSHYSPPHHDDKVMNVPIRPYADLSDWSRVNRAQSQASIRETENLLRGAHDPDKIKRLLSVQQDKLGHKLLGMVEDTKINLTGSNTATTSLSDIGIDTKVTVQRAEMEGDIAPLITRINDGVHDCLGQAGVMADEIELVILTGGSTELPIINRMVGEIFPQASVSNKNKFGSVGLGLAQYAGEVFG